MCRRLIVLCALSCSVAVSEASCSGSQTLAELKQCLGRTPDAHQECIEDGSTYQQVLDCLVKFNDTSSDPDNSTHIVYEDPLDNITDLDILDSWFNSQRWRYFLSDVGRPGTRQVKDVWISYVTVTGGSGSKGAVILVPGNGETVHNYDETIRNLHIMGYSPIYAMAHRGKGKSDRLLDDHFKTYVESSFDYVKDFGKFLGIARDEMAASSSDRDKPLFLFCHSLGCAVSFTYLIQEYEYQRPNVFHAVVAAAPLIKADTTPFPYGVAVAIGETMLFFGQGESYAPTQEQGFDKFDDNTCVDGSTSRCLRIKRRCRDHGTQQLGRDSHIGLCLGGVTGSSAKEFFDLYADTFQGFMAQAGKKIVPPILVQQSGDPQGTDKLVFNPQQTEFCNKACARCTLISYPSAKHHVVSEVDSIYFDFLKKADEFYQNNRNKLMPQGDLPDYIKEEGEGCNADLDCYSRFCDAHFAFDVFGGACKNDTAVMTISSALPQHGLSLIAVVVGAIATLLN